MRTSRAALHILLVAGFAILAPGASAQAAGTGSIITLPAASGAATADDMAAPDSAASATPAASTDDAPTDIPAGDNPPGEPDASAPAPAAVTAGHCAVWSTADEDSAGKTYPTATACSSTADDSTSIGVQCPGKTAQIRYYPQDADLPAGIKRGTKVSMDFGVDPDHVTKVMQYDDVNGVFTSALKKAEPLLTLLESGGPLIVNSTELGSHTFRLLGSTAAIQAAFDKCAHPPRAAPVPAPVLPKPKPRVVPPSDQMPDDQYYQAPYDDQDVPPRRYRQNRPQRRPFFFPFAFGND